MKFYLAGPFVSYESDGKQYSDWRDFLIEKVKLHEFIDPRKNDQTCPATFSPQDLEGVLSSDGVFAYNTPRGEAVGAAWEQGVAAGASKCGKNIPTIYVDENSFPFPLLTATAKRSFSNLNASVSYLNKLISWEKEFEAIGSYLTEEGQK